MELNSIAAACRRSPWSRTSNESVTATSPGLCTARGFGLAMADAVWRLAAMASGAVSIASPGLKAQINPIGGELWRLQEAEGRDLLSDGDPARWTGRAPLRFPLIGRADQAPPPWIVRLRRRCPAPAAASAWRCAHAQAYRSVPAAAHLPPRMARKPLVARHQGLRQVRPAQRPPAHSDLRAQDCGIEPRRSAPWRRCSRLAKLDH